MTILGPEHRAGLERHLLELGIELDDAIEREDRKLGVPRVVVDDASQGVADHGTGWGS